MRPMSKIVRSMGGVLYPLIAVFGGYLILHGHLTPGGGFQGGAVAASAVALVVVAYGGTLYKKGVLSTVESFGLLLFLGAGLIGMSAAFFANTLANAGGLFGDAVSFGVTDAGLNTGGTVPLMNIAVGCEVIGGLGLIILALSKAAFTREVD
ncbi:MAG: sodium:proton antiporter [Thermoplasmata archaeon]|nr:sodium:proton antiporter [Thermoplasmata archaeon]